MKPLYKTVIVIWSDEDPTDRDLSFLASEAEGGCCYCSKQESRRVSKPEKDPDWDGTEFFNDGEEKDE